jgi:hypothetical protein
VTDLAGHALQMAAAVARSRDELRKLAAPELEEVG